MQAHIAAIRVEELISVIAPVAVIAGGIALTRMRQVVERWQRLRPRGTRPLGGRRPW